MQQMLSVSTPCRRRRDEAGRAERQPPNSNPQISQDRLERSQGLVFAQTPRNKALWTGWEERFPRRWEAGKSISCTQRQAAL